MAGFAGGSWECRKVGADRRRRTTLAAKPSLHPPEKPSPGCALPCATKRSLARRLRAIHSRRVAPEAAPQVAPQVARAAFLLMLFLRGEVSLLDRRRERVGLVWPGHFSKDGNANGLIGGGGVFSEWKCIE